METSVNNGILHVDNGTWKLPVNGDTLSTGSLSNTIARMFLWSIGELFDVIFITRKLVTTCSVSVISSTAHDNNNTAAHTNPYNCVKKISEHVFTYRQYQN